MKKIIFIAVIFVFVAIPVSAEQSKYYDRVVEYTKEYGVEFETLKNNPLQSLLDTAKQAVVKGFTNPFKSFYKIIAVLLLTSFVSFFATDKSKQIINIVNIISVVVLFTNIFNEFSILSQQISNSLNEIKNFMTTFIPVFAGISFASGEFITSTVYTGFFLVTVVATAVFCTSFIIPSLNLFLALGIASSISEIIDIKPLCELYCKAMKFAMVAAVTLLCFVLTLQTTITSSQDSMALKTGKLLIGSTVPVIGSVLQGAAGSIYAGMGVLKGFFGIAGVVVVINLFLPTIVKLAINWLVYYLMSVLSGILENKAAGGVFNMFKDIMEILLSMSFLFMILLIFSLTIMIKVTAGG